MNSNQSGEVGGQRGGRTMSFLVNFFCTIVAYIGHLGYFIPHLMNKKADFGCKVLKKWTSKTEKNEKMQKQPIFGRFWSFRITKSVLPEFCHSCKVISCSSFANQDGWEAEKLCNSVQTRIRVGLSKTPHFHKGGPSRKLRVSAKSKKKTFFFKQLYTWK